MAKKRSTAKKPKASAARKGKRAKPARGWKDALASAADRVGVAKALGWLRQRADQLAKAKKARAKKTTASRAKKAAPAPASTE
jgi:hypothetical protein